MNAVYPPGAGERQREAIPTPGVPHSCCGSAGKTSFHSFSLPNETKSFQKQILVLKNFPLPMDAATVLTCKQSAMKTEAFEHTECYCFSSERDVLLCYPQSTSKSRECTQTLTYLCKTKHHLSTQAETRRQTTKHSELQSISFALWNEVRFADGRHLGAGGARNQQQSGQSPQPGSRGRVAPPGRWSFPCCSYTLRTAEGTIARRKQR